MRILPVRFVAALAAPMFCMVAFAQEAAMPPAIGYKDTFQINYPSSFIATLPLVYATNPGFHAAGLGVLGFTVPPEMPGDICVNIYTYRPDQTFINCCSCKLSSNGLLSLTGNNLFPGIGGSVSASGAVVKLLATVARAAPSVCDPTVTPLGSGSPGGYA